MDRRTGADRDSSTALPTGQTSRGYSNTSSRNPKNHESRRPEHIAYAPDQGGAALKSGVGRDVHSDGYPETVDPARFSAGNPSSIPGPDTTNRGYTQVTGANVPRPSRNISSNRQKYGIDPGTPPQPSGDNSEGPTIPRFGVGTSGE